MHKKNLQLSKRLKDRGGGGENTKNKNKKKGKKGDKSKSKTYAWKLISPKREKPRKKNVNNKE